MLFLSSFAAIMGPWAYLQHLASTPRLPFTAAYFGSLGLTLYFSIGVSQACPRTMVDTDAEGLLATKHDSHTVCGALPTGIPHMVSCELLPDGVQRTASCEQFWCPQGSGLDDELKEEGHGPRHSVCTAAILAQHRHCTVECVKWIVSSDRAVTLQAVEELVSGTDNVAYRVVSCVRNIDPASTCMRQAIGRLRSHYFQPYHYGRRHGPANSNPESHKSADLAICPRLFSRYHLAWPGRRYCLNVVARSRTCAGHQAEQAAGQDDEYSVPKGRVGNAEP